MFQSHRKEPSSTALGQFAVPPRVNSGAESRGMATGQAASRVLEVNRPWLQKGLYAIAQWESNAQEREWLCKRLDFFVGSRRNDVSQTTENDVLLYLDGQAKNGQKDWQVLQSLSAICYLLEFGNRWQSNATFRRAHRIRRSTPSCLSSKRSYNDRWGIWGRSFALNGRSICLSCSRRTKCCECSAN